MVGTKSNQRRQAPDTVPIRIHARTGLDCTVLIVGMKEVQNIT